MAKTGKSGRFFYRFPVLRCRFPVIEFLGSRFWSLDGNFQRNFTCLIKFWQRLFPSKSLLEELRKAKDFIISSFRRTSWHSSVLWDHFFQFLWSGAKQSHYDDSREAWVKFHNTQSWSFEEVFLQINFRRKHYIFQTWQTTNFDWISNRFYVKTFCWLLAEIQQSLLQFKGKIINTFLAK